MSIQKVSDVAAVLEGIEDNTNDPARVLAELACGEGEFAERVAVRLRAALPDYVVAIARSQERLDRRQTS